MKIIKDMEIMVASLRPSFEAVSWDDPTVYGNWLSQAYYIASKSTSFLGLCLLHADRFPAFRERCVEHIGEEAGHETLIENDLRKLGHCLFHELPQTMAFYQPQYYQIVCKNPLAFMGYVFFLELLAPEYGPYVTERVTNKGALSFIKVHTKSDEDHVEKATKIVETMSEDQRKLALANFDMSFVSYRSMLEIIASGIKDLQFLSAGTQTE